MAEAGEVSIQETGEILEQSERESYVDVDSLSFDDLQSGSKFRVYYSQEADNPKPSYSDLEVIGRRKSGLRVVVAKSSREEPPFEATLPGNYRGEYADKPSGLPTGGEARSTPGILRIATPSEANILYLKSLKHPRSEKFPDGYTQPWLSTAPIRRISVKTDSPQP